MVKMKKLELSVLGQFDDYIVFKLVTRITCGKSFGANGGHSWYDKETRIELQDTSRGGTLKSLGHESVLSGDVMLLGVTPYACLDKSDYKKVLKAVENYNLHFNDEPVEFKTPEGRLFMLKTLEHGYLIPSEVSSDEEPCALCDIADHCASMFGDNGAKCPLRNRSKNWSKIEDAVVEAIMKDQEEI
jgi:hypothetical protein